MSLALYQTNEIKPFTSVNSIQYLKFYTEGENSSLIKYINIEDNSLISSINENTLILQYNLTIAQERFYNICTIMSQDLVEIGNKNEEVYIDGALFVTIVNPYFKLSWTDSEANGALRIMDQLKYSDDPAGITEEDFNNLAEGQNVKGLQLKALHSSGRELKMYSPADCVITFDDKPTNGFATISLTYDGVKVCEDCIVVFE